MPQKVIEKVYEVKTSTRLLSSFGLATFVSLGLFYFMSQLITGSDLKKSDNTEDFIEFVRIKRPSTIETRQRKLPPKPTPQQKQTPKEVFNVAKNEATPNRPQNMKFDQPKLDFDLAAGPGGMGMGGGGGGTAGSGNGDSDLVAKYLVEPQYPRSMAMKQIEGWVRLSIDVGKDGSVIGASVVESSHRPFERPALNAIMRSKFRAKLVDGKPTVMKGKKYQMSFKLAK